MESSVKLNVILIMISNNQQNYLSSNILLILAIDFSLMKIISGQEVDESTAISSDIVFLVLVPSEV